MNASERVVDRWRRYTGLLAGDRYAIGLAVWISEKNRMLLSDTDDRRRNGLPPFWEGVMQVVALGKACVAGAGAAMALLGLYVLVFVLIDRVPFDADAPVLQWGAGVGAAIGAILQATQWIRSRS